MGETGPPVNSAARPARQPVLGSRDRSPSASARGETGPAQGETGSRTLDFLGQAERPVPGRGDRSLWAKTAQSGLIERKGRRRRRRGGEGACLEALEHHLLPHFSPLEAWSLLLELCGGSNFNPTWF
uniref:Uncharacterized protein n=1 Tax=Ananas comosus var. bracteatus TaxID=296719 RepID=A0A6V7NX41_ANACO|nr:unnamed protein product [Ananas comosus var. bracteatus]